MYQDYSNPALIAYAEQNLYDLVKSGSFAALLIERLSAYYDGDKFVDAEGYDQLEESTSIKKEVKSTKFVQNETNFRIQAFQKKRGKFDYIKIIDALNNRISLIPHDDFFTVVGDNSEFRWSAFYGVNPNTNRNIRPAETELFLKYEVTNAK